MNLEQLKAKYAKGTEAAKEVKSSTTGKVWGATKTAAKATGGFVYGVMPATNRRVNSIAEELNTQLNNHEFELFKHDVMIEMIAQKVGVTLPDDDTLYAYFVDAQASSQPVAESSESVESFAGKVFEAVMSKLKKLPVEETEVEEVVVEEVEPTKPKRKGKGSKSKPAPQEAEVIEDYSEEAAEARAKEEALRKKKEQETPKEDKPKKGRRRLGRQEPLTKEEE